MSSLTLSVRGVADAGGPDSVPARTCLVNCNEADHLYVPDKKGPMGRMLLST